MFRKKVFVIVSTRNGQVDVENTINASSEDEALRMIRMFWLKETFMPALQNKYHPKILESNEALLAGIKNFNTPALSYHIIQSAISR